MRKLNLGCGHEILKDYENYDYRPMTKEVKYLDLNKLPLPFKNNSIDEIRLSHVLEHLTISHLDFMTDIYRILKPNGFINVGLPVYSPTLYHNQHNFIKGYFNCITGKKQLPEIYLDGTFKLEKVLYDRKRFKYIIYTILDTYRRFFKANVTYKLRKVDNENINDR